MDLLSVIPPVNSLAWFKSKKPIVYSAATAEQLLSPDKYFWAAAAQSLEQTKQIQSALAAAIKQGRSFDAWRRSLNTGDLKLDNPTTVWRTNIFNALNANKYAEMVDIADDFPWLKYETTLDEKVRPNHAANHGLTMRMDDPRWEGRVPALGFNCRCQLIQLSTDERNAKPGLANPPDNGNADLGNWGHSPFKAALKVPKSVAAPPEAAAERLADTVQTPRVTQADAVAATGPEYVTLLDALVKKLRLETTGTGGMREIPADVIKTNRALAGKTFAELTDYQLLAIWEYTDSLYREIRGIHNRVKLNPELRLNDRDVEHVRLIGQMRDGLERAAPWVADIPSSSKQIKLPRSDPAVLNRTTLGLSRESLAVREKLRTAAPGDVFQLDGPTSFNRMAARFNTLTPEDKNIETVEILVTKLARKTKAVHVGKFSVNYDQNREDEVVMWNGSVRILKVEEYGSVLRVYVEEIDPNTARPAVHLSLATHRNDVGAFYGADELSDDELIDIIRAGW